MNLSKEQGSMLMETVIVMPLLVALIFGAPNRRSRNGDDAVNIACVAKTLEHLERADGLRHTLRLQKAVPVHILSEAYALLELVLDHEMIPEDIDNDKSCGIGAQINDPYALRRLLQLGSCFIHIHSRPFA